MRIVTGKFKGRVLLSPPRNLNLRPTSDRVREAIFDVIRFDLVDKVFLDLFAGSGSVGIEAISEGAKFVYFVENNSVAIETIKKNILTLNISDSVKIYFMDVFKFLSSANLENLVDFVFLDPPYKSHYATLTLQSLTNFRYMSSGCIVIAEHSEEEVLQDSYSGMITLERFKEKTYGKVVVSYYFRQS